MALAFLLFVFLIAIMIVVFFLLPPEAIVKAIAGGRAEDRAKKPAEKPQA